MHWQQMRTSDQEQKEKQQRGIGWSDANEKQKVQSLEAFHTRHKQESCHVQADWLVD